MATFLDLVVKAERESGTMPSVLSAVTGQSGRHLKFVSWVADAWTRIQNLHDSWEWMRKEFSGDLTAGTPRYTAASWNITDWSRWVQQSDTLTMYLTATGVADEGPLSGPMTWHDYRRYYERGTQTNQRPVWWALSPQEEMCFGSRPDDDYTVRGEYWKLPQTLAANGDIPECPAQYHDIIVWRALQIMAEHDEAPSAIATANYNYKELLGDLERTQLLSHFTITAASIGSEPLA